MQCAAESRSHLLKVQLYKCKFGGVPRNISANRGNRDPIHRQAVPVRSIYDADEENARLQQQIFQLKQEGPSHREALHNLNQLCTAVEVERAARERAESAFAEATTEVAEVKAEAASVVASVLQGCKQRVRDADAELQKAQGRVLCLGSQVTAANVEHNGRRWCVSRNYGRRWKWLQPRQS